MLLLRLGCDKINAACLMEFLWLVFDDFEEEDDERRGTQTPKLIMSFLIACC